MSKCCIIKINLYNEGECGMFKSEFCEVTYMKKENIVLIRWLKFCKGEDYRTPLRFALQLLREHRNSNVIADARNGFEDEEEDVRWAFREFIPQMAQTDCKKIVFFTNEVNDIEGEIDMFTKEFLKYFEVKNVTSWEEAISEFSSSIILNVLYTIKPGQRTTFYEEVKKARIPELSRLEEGNLRYEYYFPIEDENKILLIEIWKNQMALELHKEMEHFKKLQTIKQKYVTDVKFEQYTSVR